MSDTWPGERALVLGGAALIIFILTAFSSLLPQAAGSASSLV